MFIQAQHTAFPNDKSQSPQFGRIPQMALAGLVVTSDMRIPDREKVRFWKGLVNIPSGNVHSRPCPVEYPKQGGFLGVGQCDGGFVLVRHNGAQQRPAVGRLCDLERRLESTFAKAGALDEC